MRMTSLSIEEGKIVICLDTKLLRQKAKQEIEDYIYSLDHEEQILIDEMEVVEKSLTNLFEEVIDDGLVPITNFLEDECYKKALSVLTEVREKHEKNPRFKEYFIGDEEQC